MPITPSLLAPGELPAVPPLLLALLQDTLAPVHTPTIFPTLLHDPVLCAELLQQFSTQSDNPLRDFEQLLSRLSATQLQQLLRRHASRQVFHPSPTIATPALQRIWRQQARLQAVAELMTASLPPAEQAEIRLTLSCLPLGWLQQLQQQTEFFADRLSNAETIDRLDEDPLPAANSGILLSAEWLQQLAPASLAGDALRYLLWHSRQLQYAAPQMVRLAAIWRLALPRFSVDDDPLPLLHALGHDDATARALTGRANAHANAAEQRCQRQLDDYQPRQLLRHVEQFGRIPALDPIQAGELWTALLDYAHNLLPAPMLLLRREGNNLHPVAAPSLPDSLLNQLCLPTDHPDSRIAAVLTSPEPTLLEAPLPAIIDRQLLRLLDTERLLCLPLQDEAGQTSALLLCSQPPDQQDPIAALYACTHLSQRLQQLLRAEQRDHQRRDSLHAQHQRRAAELVHEVANPLSVTRNYLQVLSRKLEHDDQAAVPLSTIRDELERIEALLQAYRSGPESPADPEQTVDLNATVRQLANLFERSSDELQLSTQLDPTLTPFYCASGPVHQIITNLLKNASEAMHGQGQITLRTRAGVNLNGRNHAELRIRDSGPGLPDEILEYGMGRAVTASLTAPSAPRGLGLQIVAELCHQLGASISCRNPLDGGAQFVLLLPCPTSEPEKEL